MKLKTLIVEDHKDSANYLSTLLELEQDLEIVGIFNNWVETREFIDNSKPDLIFLDINLNGVDALSLMNEVDSNRKRFDFILTTGNPDRLIEAIRMDAADYLVKPVDRSELQSAIKKVIAKRYFRTKNNRLIRYEDIAYIQSDRNHIIFHSTIGESLPPERMTLGKVEEYLPSVMFCKVHRSYIVNRDLIKEFTKTSIFLKNGLNIPASEKLVKNI